MNEQCDRSEGRRLPQQHAPRSMRWQRSSSVFVLVWALRGGHFAPRIVRVFCFFSAFSAFSALSAFSAFSAFLVILAFLAFLAPLAFLAFSAFALLFTWFPRSSKFFYPPSLQSILAEGAIALPVTLIGGVLFAS